MSQRYTDSRALSRMLDNLCPECGYPASAHLDDNRFWIPRTCSLLPRGVEDRIRQYFDDLAAVGAAVGVPLDPTE